MQKKRSVLNFCLVVLLVFGLLPLNTWAIENEKHEDDEGQKTEDVIAQL